MLLPNTGHSIGNGLAPRIFVVTTWIDQVLKANEAVTQKQPEVPNS